MRTTSERATRTVALLVIATMAVACAAAPSLSPVGSPSPPPVATEIARPSGPATTPVPTPGPASPQPTPVAFLDAKVLAANTTPWPVAAISAGWNICAIGTDERLRCWASADEAPKGAFKAIAAGQGTSCGIRTDGTVDCWGEIGLHSPRGRFTALGVGQGQACGIRTGGSVHCWWTHEEDDGNRARAADDPDLPAGTYTDLTVDLDSGGCALRDDGAIACWGADDIPVPKPSGTFISLGDSCGIKDTGEIECFGWAEWYGDGPAPQLPAGPFVRMDGSRFHGCAIRENGALACWGDGGGYDDNGNALPLSTPPGAYTDVTVGEYYACARGSEGRAVCWGENAEAARPAPTVLVADSAFVTGSKVSVSWRATPISAPITGFDVEYTTDEWAEDDAGNEVERHWVSLLTGTNKSSATLEGREGAAYCWRVRARDADGIMSDWTGPYHCTAVPIDERSLKATGAWTPLEGPGYYKGTALKTTTRGATLLISQEGAFGLVILATTCRGCGTFILRYPQQGCWEDEEEEPTPQASCPPDEEQVELRGPRDDSAIAFMGNDGQEGYAGPLELVVTSSGKPVIIDGVIFADTE